MLSSTGSGPVGIKRNNSRVLACALAAACYVVCNEAYATNYTMEDRYNPQHITSLPPEIRSHVYAICEQPRALHNFSEYRDNSRIVILHFEHFICGASQVRCSVSGCLHEVFTLSRGGRYKLTGRYYSKEPFR